MQLEIMLPIAAFIALAAGLAVVLRGTGKIVARTREVDQFRGAVKDLAARADASLGGAAGQIDAVRRRQVDPGPDRGHDRGRHRRRPALHGGGPRPEAAQPGPADPRSDLVADLERAERALGMVEHGTTTMLTARRGPRELEAQTSIKRGYLNLIHAREAIARHALDAEALPSANDAAKVGRGSV